MKIAKRIKENRIFFVMFSVFMINTVYWVGSRGFKDLVGAIYYPLYAVDFSCGYSSRLLVGQLFSFFIKDKLDVYLLTAILLSLVVICYFLISLYINSRLKNTNYKELTYYCILMSVSPTLMSFLTYLGNTDAFWVFFALGSFVCIDKKFFRWLVPVFCVLGLATHEAFVSNYLPVIVLAGLYQLAKKPTAGNFGYVGFSAVLILGGFIYFMLIGDSTMKMTSDEMSAYVQSRLGLRDMPFDDSYMRAAFFWEADGVENYSGLFGYFLYNIQYYFLSNSGIMNSAIINIIISAVSMIPYLWLVIKAFCIEKNVFKKIIFLLSTLLLPLMVFMLITATDLERYSMHAILSSIFFILFLVREKDESFVKSYDSIKKTLYEHKFMFVLAGIPLLKIILSGVMV